MSSLNISPSSEAKRISYLRAASGRRGSNLAAHMAVSNSSENDSSWEFQKPIISKAEGRNTNHTERGQRLPSSDFDHNKLSHKHKRSYVQVANDKRAQLVNMVNQNQCTIKAAANQLGINYSTAKHIYKQHTLLHGESQVSVTAPIKDFKSKVECDSNDCPKSEAVNSLQVQKTSEFLKHTSMQRSQSDNENLLSTIPVSPYAQESSSILH